MTLSPASIILYVALALPAAAVCQATQPDQSSESNLPAQITQKQAPAPYDRPVSWRRFIPNLLSDQAQIWTFPVRLAQGQDLLPTTAILGGTAGLIALDPTQGAYFHRTSTFQGFNNIFTGNATALGTVLAPVSLYAIGSLRKDSKMTHTALLAGEAVADAELVTMVLKDTTMRVRPAATPTNGNYADSWFESGGSRIRSSGSFPSGHTIAAISVATVVARRYGNHRWVPYVAYGAAALVAFSRLTLSAHFLSDVFMGGALGYSISRFTVLRQ